VIDAGHERARTGADGAADAVTFAFGDLGRGLYGLARLGVADGRASALAVVFRDREPLGAIAEGGLEVTGDDWDQRSAGDLSTAVHAPLERWAVSWTGRFELEFVAASAPAELSGGGMEGYVQLCTVSGTVDGVRFEGLGERRHEWGAADWEELELVRTVSVWLGEEDGGVSLSSLRPAGARGHDEEHVSAALVERGDPVVIGDPRLTTTYDGDGHQRRAGLELWVGEDDPYPRRLAGEVICGSSLDLGQLRLELAFMRWHGDGAEGVGRYDVLRRSA
jgi:hypothetical protein